MDLPSTTLNTKTLMAELGEDHAGIGILSAIIDAAQVPNTSPEAVHRSFVQYLMENGGEAEASSLALILLEALGAARACSVAAEAMGRLDQAALGAYPPVR